MTYSACDFMDDVLGVVDIPNEIACDIDPEDTAAWAEETVSAIQKAQEDRAELLAAINSIIDYAESRCEDLQGHKEAGNEDPDYPGADEAWAALEIARAAIARAEGRQP